MDEESTYSDNYFPFLDIKIFKENNSFATCTYYKPTHTGLFTNWYSYTPRKYKINLVKTLLFRAWNICSNKNLFQRDVFTIKKNLLKNQFPEGLLNAIIKNFSESIEKEPASKPVTVPKKEVILILPYLGTLSESFERSLKSLIAKAYYQVDVKIVFKTTNRIANLFHVKDTIPKRLISNVIYGVYCTECTAFYVGKTKRHLSKRFQEHKDIKKITAVSAHMIESNHDVKFDDVKVISRGSYDLELLIKETLIIKKLKPSLNANVTSFPLEMF